MPDFTYDLGPLESDLPVSDTTETSEDFYDYDPEGVAADADMLSDGNYETPDDELADNPDDYDTPPEHVSHFTTEPRTDVPPLESRRPQPETLVQSHRIGEKVIVGEHPDKRIARHIGELAAGWAEKQERLTEALAEMPNQNGVYGAALEKLAAIGHDHYGIDPPMTILTREQVAAVAHRIDDPDFVRFQGGGNDRGHIIIVAEDESLAAYGPDYLVSIGMHELGHARTPSYHAVETVKVDSDDDQIFMPHDAVKGQWGRQYKVGDIKTTGIMTPAGIFSPFKRVEGLLWDEGRVDGRRVRTQQQEGLAVQGPNTKAEHVHLDQYTTVTMTAEGIGTPLISPDTHEVAVPWRYALALQMNNNQPRLMFLPAAGMAAYAVDLLEKYALPGITEQLDSAALTQDPVAAKQVKDRINSVNGELYDRLAGSSHTYRAFMNGLRHVIHVLEISKKSA